MSVLLTSDSFLVCKKLPEKREVGAQCSPKSRRRRTHIQDLKPTRRSNTHSSSNSQPQSPAIPMRPSVRSSAVTALFVTVLFASPVFGSDYDHKVNFYFKPQPFDLRHGYSIC